MSCHVSGWKKYMNISTNVFISFIHLTQNVTHKLFLVFRQLVSVLLPLSTTPTHVNFRCVIGLFKRNKRILYFLKQDFWKLVIRPDIDASGGQWSWLSVVPFVLYDLSLKRELSGTSLYVYKDKYIILQQPLFIPRKSSGCVKLL